MSEGLKYGYGRKRLLAWDPNPEGKGPESFSAFARALTEAAQRWRGERPWRYTKIAVCLHCGPVWVPEHLEDAPEVCPWCINRVDGRPIPRPGRKTLATGARMESSRLPGPRVPTSNGRALVWV